MIKLIVDTTCEIFPEEAKSLGIISLPMKLIFDQTIYTPGVDLSNKEFYKKLSECKELPHTSQLNMFDYTLAIKPLIDEGHDVFVMCISDKLSGSFNSLEQAKNDLKSDKVEILNTKTITFAYQSLVFEAIKLIKQGVTLKELKEKMLDLTKRVEMLAIVDNVSYLIKGGRLSATLGFLVKTLHIKPIVRVVEGELKVVSKAIGFITAKKTLKSLIEDIDEDMPLFLGHSNDLEKSKIFGDYIENELGIKFTRVAEIGPIIGTHAGPGCVGFSYFRNED